MNSYTVYDILDEIDMDGLSSNPRGQEIRELHYFQGQILSPWSNYEARNYPVDYFKREMQWYLGADPYDTRICEHAKMWNKLVQSTGKIFSNYGYYWFNPEYMTGMTGFDWVVSTLRNDPDSRQAYIPMNNFTHAFPGNPDFVCTKGIQFRIVSDQLHCHVAMRSSDAIYGLATDLPCFWTLWAMVANALDVQMGGFVLSADSLHVYEKHFEMVAHILDDGPHCTVPLSGPEITDYKDLISGTYESEFGQWLTEVKL